jgi:hypothetical protein
LPSPVSRTSGDLANLQGSKAPPTRDSGTALHRSRFFFFFFLRKFLKEIVEGQICPACAVELSKTPARDATDPIDSALENGETKLDFQDARSRIAGTDSV